MYERYIAVEKIVKKGEIACNKQFLLFSQCFLSYMVLTLHFKCTLKCLRFVDNKRKGGNVGYQHFLHDLQCFQKLLSRMS